MEDKTFIADLLHLHADSLIQFVNKQTQESFMKSADAKWTVGQNIEHLIQSLAPVNQALLLPAFVLRVAFGKPNRSARTYQQLVERYHQKLSAGGTAPRAFIPAPVLWIEKDDKIAQFKIQKVRMIKRMQSWNENQLDQHLLPHPLLGKITVREMLFFSAYHIQHHTRLLEARA